MPIAFKGAPDEQGSPFLAVHERTGQEWSRAATSLGALATGSFNAWHFEGNLTFTDGSGTWTISGNRHLSTIGGGIPIDSPIHEMTHIHGRLGLSPPIAFSIRKNDVRSRILTLFGKPSFPSGIASELVVVSPDIAAFRRAIEGHEREMLDLNLRKLEVDLKGRVEAHFSKLITTSDTLLRACNVLSRLVSSR